jgi:thiamine monophosphate synthase
VRLVPRLLSISPPDPGAAATWVARAPELVAAGADGLLLRVLVDSEPRIRSWLETLIDTGATLLVHARTPGGRELASELGIGLHLPDGAASSAGTGLAGASCHDRLGLDRAAEGCDYALLSPVFSPASKQSNSRPLGVRGFGAAIEGVRLPVLALGGINPSRIPGCLQAGAHGVAGIGAFGDAEAVAAMAQVLQGL